MSLVATSSTASQPRFGVTSEVAPPPDNALLFEACSSPSTQPTECTQQFRRVQSQPVAVCSHVPDVLPSPSSSHCGSLSVSVTRRDEVPSKFSSTEEDPQFFETDTGEDSATSSTDEAVARYSSGPVGQSPPSFSSKASPETVAGTAVCPDEPADLQSLCAGEQQPLPAPASGKEVSGSTSCSADTSSPPVQCSNLEDDLPLSRRRSASEGGYMTGDDDLSSPHWQKKDVVELLQPPPHFTISRQEVLTDFQGKKIYLFLDYDGTLTPIVSNPWEAKLSPHMRQLLYDLAADSSNLFTIGIVTGRALTSVKNFVQIAASEKLNFIYAASHGFHIEAAGRMLHHRVGSRYIPILKDAAGEVEKALQHIPGIALEDNEFAVSVHYRNTAEGSEREVEEIVTRVLEHYPALKMTRGKKVFELRINVVWDKGRAVLWLLNAMRVDPFEDDTRVVYIGDDLTDEDAFRAVRQFDKGLSVLVSDVPATRPTAAAYFVKDPDEVAALLEDFLRLARGESGAP